MNEWSYTSTPFLCFRNMDSDNFTHSYPSPHYSVRTHDLGPKYAQTEYSVLMDMTINWILGFYTAESLV
jgi:hypothetical protein